MILECLDWKYYSTYYLGQAALTEVSEKFKTFEYHQPILYPYLSMPLIISSMNQHLTKVAHLLMLSLSRNEPLAAYTAIHVHNMITLAATECTS